MFIKKGGVTRSTKKKKKADTNSLSTVLWGEHPHPGELGGQTPNNEVTSKLLQHPLGANYCRGL